MSRKNKIRRIVAACVSEPWMITPSKLDEIRSLLEARSSGIEFTEAEIQSRIGGAPRQQAESAYRLVGSDAIIPLMGVLAPKVNLMSQISGGTSTQQFSAAVAQAERDPAVKRHVIDVDSPGGTAMGNEEAAQVIRNATKPTIAVATGNMCSAAYYIASAADEVVASPSSSVGSIGTIGMHVDQSAADKAAGLKYTPIFAGTHKADAGGHEPLSKQSLATMQEQVDALNTQFVQAVAVNRDISVEQVNTSYGQGKHFLAAEALSRGMIDRIATLEEVLSSPVQTTKSRPTSAITNSSIDWSPTMAKTNTIDASSEVDATAIERSRVLNIQAVGKGLNVADGVVQAAVADGVSLETFREYAEAGEADRNRPVGRIESGQASADKLVDQASDALCARSGLETSANFDSSQNSLAHSSLVRIAEESLRSSDPRAVGRLPDEIAIAALSESPGSMLITASTGGAFNGAGSFPAILSNIARKVLLGPLTFQPFTYKEWATKLDPLPDFKPSTVLQTGDFGEMPYHPDGKDFQQSTMSEEAGWIQVESYGDEFALTPKMIVDDNLNAFTESLKSKRLSHDSTLNRLCVNILTGNPALATDDKTLFHADHGNDIAGGAGAPPDEAEMDAMNLLLRKQTGAGDIHKLGLPLALLLIPEDLETSTRKLLEQTIQQAAQATADTNAFRGKIKWLVDPMLADSSVAQYFGFAPKGTTRSIGYAHQTGFEQMQTRNYFNPKNNCRFYQFEGRFAAVAMSHRGVVRNAGA